MGVRLGDEVGYAVRFESKERSGSGSGSGKAGSGSTKVRFCTEGVLLRSVRRVAWMEVLVIILGTNDGREPLTVCIVLYNTPQGTVQSRLVVI